MVSRIGERHEDPAKMEMKNRARGKAIERVREREKRKREIER